MSEPGPWIGDGALSPQAQARLARASSSHMPVPVPDLADPDAVVAWRAAVHEAWGEDDTDPPTHHEETIGGRRCLVAGADDAPVVVYAHGGGYALGSPGVAVPITARLADALRVVSVDYRLAPEHPFPAALDDVVAVARAAGRSGAFALAGDSAGGGLAVAAAVRLAATGSPVPAALVLLSPHLDHGAATDALGRAYVAGADPLDPAISPVHTGRADLAALPPTLVQVAADEAMFGPCVRFARRARAAGAVVTLDVWDGLWHTWHYHRELPEADRALAEAAAFVVSRLRPGPTPGGTGRATPDARGPAAA